MSHALLAIQNILPNSNIFIGSRETVLFMPFGKKKVTQVSGLLPASVSYLNSPECLKAEDFGLTWITISQCFSCNVYKLQFTNYTGYCCVLWETDIYVFKPWI